MSHTYAVDLERTAPLRLGRHPRAPVAESWQQWVEQQTRPLAIDLFAGAGGLSLGLEEAGYRVILAVDTDPWAIETHRHNFPGVSLDLDLGKPENIETLIALLADIELDLVAGGPPCQPFSRAGRSKIRSLVDAGKRSHKDERKELWQSFLAIVEAVQPKACLMENVPDMALGDDFAVVREMVARLEDLGYDAHFALLDAWKYSVPQHRQRFFLVGLREGHAFNWPRRSKAIVLREAIGDLPKLEGSSGSREIPYRKTMRSLSAYQKAARARMTKPVIWDHITRPVRDDDREAFSLLRPGGTYAELPERLRRYRVDIFDDKYKKLSWRERSRSITAHIAKDGYWYIHPSEHRTLTVREAARIQTFPDHFRLAGTRSHAFAQIGNAVPPALARAIGRSILTAIESPVLTKYNRNREQWARVRRALVDWAEKDRIRLPWRYPGTVWTVLAGTILAARPHSGKPTPQDFLRELPSPEEVSPERLRKMNAIADSSSQKQAVRRLWRIARMLSRTPRLWDRDDWPRKLGLMPAEELKIRTLALGEDRLIATAPALRVVARLTGSEVDHENEMTQGRLLIARIVSAGQDSPLITAALLSLGRDICTASNPACSRCPLQRYCASSGN